jgi:sodium-dependent phosphate transporter
VANSFATSVGSQVLTLGQACCIAVFTEFLGAVMLGANTTNTIRNGILDVNDFAGRPDLLMYGMYLSKRHALHVSQAPIK